MLTAVNATFTENPLTAAKSGTAAANGNDPNAAQDRFLKLLVAQLNNQDPMNPLDNAQMTSQMAQINTVTSVQQVNETLKSMAGQFTAVQMMQASGLVGRDVLIPGDTLAIKNGVGQAAYTLPSRADSVRLEVLSPGGQVVGTLDLGPQEAGQHPITWDASTYAFAGNPSFRIIASAGGQAVVATPATRATVAGVALDQQTVQLQLQGRAPVAYSAVQSIY